MFCLFSRVNLTKFFRKTTHKKTVQRNTENDSNSINNLLPVVLVLAYAFTPGKLRNVHYLSSHRKTRYAHNIVRLLNTPAFLNIESHSMFGGLTLTGFHFPAQPLSHSFSSQDRVKKKIEKLMHQAENRDVTCWL